MEVGRPPLSRVNPLIRYGPRVYGAMGSFTSAYLTPTYFTPTYFTSTKSPAALTVAVDAIPA